MAPGPINRYFGQLDTGKMKIRGVVARKGDTHEYVRCMKEELFEVLAEAKADMSCIGLSPGPRAWSFRASALPGPHPPLFEASRPPGGPREDAFCHLIL